MHLDDETLPDVTRDEDLDGLPPIERAVQVGLRRLDLDLEVESLTGDAREWADLRVADAELALATVPAGAERDQAISTVVDELAEVLRGQVLHFKDDDNEEHDDV